MLSEALFALIGKVQIEVVSSSTRIFLSVTVISVIQVSAEGTSNS